MNGGEDNYSSLIMNKESVIDDNDDDDIERISSGVCLQLLPLKDEEGEDPTEPLLTMTKSESIVTSTSILTSATAAGPGGSFTSNITTACIETTSSSSGSRNSSHAGTPSRSSPPIRNQTVFNTSDIEYSSIQDESYNIIQNGECYESEDRVPQVGFNVLRTSDDHHAIQIDSSNLTSSSGDKRGAKKVTICNQDYAFTYSSVCGPNPRKITIVLGIVLAVWISLILGWHVHKKVSGLEGTIDSLSSKIVDLQNLYIKTQNRAAQEIDRLHERIHSLSIDERAGLKHSRETT